MKTKNEVFIEHLSAWLKAKGDKKKRGEIVRHMVFATKSHPKSVSRTFKRLQLRDPAHTERRGRRRYYNDEVALAFRDVWEAGDRGCGEVIHPMVSQYIAVLLRDSMWTHDEVATSKLLAMSERTMKRRIATFKREDGVRKRGLSGTSPSTIKHIIPIRKGPWTNTKPGDGQLDTVAHCGESLSGTFIWTLNYTDAATYWVGIRAQWNKGQEATRKSVVKIRARLPFSLFALHPDSGSEFINWHLKNWCDAEGIDLSRSEPYKKNDNMYVEERNGHVVRKYVGWQRLEVPAIVPMLNALYDVLELYLNHWKASRRMLAKERVGAKYVRTYEKRALTPYGRMMAREDITDEAKEKLGRAHDQLNPLLLLKKIATIKKQIYELAKASRNRPDTE